ncbi:MAG: hypothetical protein WDZ79_00945 [Candidatus Paceibacterota bacterium]
MNENDQQQGNDGRSPHPFLPILGMAIVVSLIPVILLALILPPDPYNGNSVLGTIVFSHTFVVVYIGTLIFDLFAGGSDHRYTKKRIVIPLGIVTVALGFLVVLLFQQGSSIHGAGSEAGLGVLLVMAIAVFLWIAICGLSVYRFLSDIRPQKTHRLIGFIAATVAVVVLAGSLVYLFQTGVFSDDIPDQDSGNTQEQVSEGAQYQEQQTATTDWQTYRNEELRIAFEHPAFLPNPSVTQFSTRSVIEFDSFFTVSIGMHLNQNREPMTIEEIAPDEDVERRVINGNQAIVESLFVYIDGPGEIVVIIHDAALDRDIDIERVAESLSFLE